MKISDCVSFETVSVVWDVYSVSGTEFAPNLKGVDMADPGTKKSTSADLPAEEKRQEELPRSTKEIEQHDLSEGLEAQDEQRVEERRLDERTEQQDLNQGMDTGTHDSTRHGVKWGAAYQYRDDSNLKPEKKDKPDKIPS
jgi:hypothetical protein